MTHRIRSFALASVAALLSACGGGGGGGSDASTAAPTVQTRYAVETAYVAVATQGASLTGSAVDGADTWTVTIATTPAVDQSFEGIAAKKSSVTMTLKKNGATVSSSGGDNLFTLSPYLVRGVMLNDGSYGVQTVAGSALSNAAVVGDSGSMGRMTVYADATKSRVLFTQDATWTLEPDTDSTAFACTNTTARDTQGQVIVTTAGCYKIDAAGSLRGMRWTLAVAGKTLTFR